MLVVDDDADVRDAIVTVLECCGATVTAAPSAAAARLALEAVRVDAILSDIAMPHS